MYELINEYRDKIYSYSVEVFSDGQYVEWGISYSTEEEAINCLKKYLFRIKDIDHNYYKKQYEDYSSHPIKVTKKVGTRNWEVYKNTINIDIK